tara:strand:- start:1517 stop:2113 length:597 start_codon:yes stop_codon:yes gene_type:complete
MELRTDFVDIKGLEFNDPKWTEGWHHNRKITRINKGISLKAFGTFLQDRGYTHITLEYEGSGDSGDAFCSEGFKSKKDFEARGGDYGHGERIGGWYGNDDIEKGTRYQKELCDLFKTYKEYNPNAQLGDSDSDLSGILVSMIDYDWYNNDGGQGEVIWDLKKETIVVEGEQNYQGQYECKETYSLNGKEPKTRYKDIR